MVHRIGACGCAVLRVPGLLNLDAQGIVLPLLVRRADVLAFKPKTVITESELEVGLAVLVEPNKIGDLVAALEVIKTMG